MTHADLCRALGVIFAAASADNPSQDVVDTAGALAMTILAQALTDLHRIANALEARAAQGAASDPVVNASCGAS